MPSNFQYYIIGWLYGRGHQCQNSRIFLELDNDEEYQFFYKLTRDQYDFRLVKCEPSLLRCFVSESTTLYKLYIHDEYVLNHLDNFDDIDNLYFKRGYFDSTGYIEMKNYITCYLPNTQTSSETPSCKTSSETTSEETTSSETTSEETTPSEINQIFGTEFAKYNARLNTVTDEWIIEENDALNFLCELYDVVYTAEPSDDYYMTTTLECILEAKQIVLDEIPKFIYYKTRENAVAPIKEFATHPGFGISACEKIEEKNGIHYYATGLRFLCEYGFYLEIYGEQLYKSGYMLANPFDIIKPGENEELIIPMIKLNQNTPELQLPFHIVNIIPKKLNLVEIYELSESHQHTPSYQ